MNAEDYHKLLESYRTPDPWGFKTHPDDARRKDLIINALSGRKFQRALDYGCGEGWITADLPADELFGWDIVPEAMARFPENVQIWDCDSTEPFDLVVATGVLYPWYGGASAVEKIRSIASNFILTCHMAEPEIPEVARLGTQIHCEFFAYRGMNEVLRIFEVPRNDAPAPAFPSQAIP